MIGSIKIGDKEYPTKSNYAMLRKFYTIYNDNEKFKTMSVFEVHDMVLTQLLLITGDAFADIEEIKENLETDWYDGGLSVEIDKLFYGKLSEGRETKNADTGIADMSSPDTAECQPENSTEPISATG
jgi:hypothetical protein